MKSAINVNFPIAVFTAPGASINSIIFSSYPLHPSVFPKSIVVCGQTIQLSSLSGEHDLELDDESHGQVLNSDQVEMDSNTVLIEVEEVAPPRSVAVLVTKQRRNKLISSTHQCFGYRKDRNRCNNRKNNFRGVWCHHHISQKILYDNQTKINDKFILSWW